MAEELGKAHVAITADTTGLDSKLGEAEGKTKTFAQKIKSTLGETVGTGAAVVGLVAAIKKLDDAYRVFLDSANQLATAQRAIGEAFGSGGSLSSGLSEYEQGMLRINAAYEKQLEMLEQMEAKRDLFTRAAEFLMGGREVDAMRQAVETEDRKMRAAEEGKRKNREDFERERAARKEAEEAQKKYEKRQDAIRDKLEKINEEAATAGLTELEKVEYERIKRIDEIGQYEHEMGEQLTNEAVANVNKIYDFKKRKIEEEQEQQRRADQKKAEESAKALQQAISGVYERLAEKQKSLFDVSDLKVHMSRIGDLLARIAQQRRAM